MKPWVEARPAHTSMGAVLLKVIPEDLKAVVFSHPDEFNTYDKVPRNFDNFLTGRKGQADPQLWRWAPWASRVEKAGTGERQWYEHRQ